MATPAGTKPRGAILFLPCPLCFGSGAAGGAASCQALHSWGALVQVYSPNMPPVLAQPSSIPPYTLVSQPSVQFILQGSLPLVGCGVAQSVAPAPTVLATASEPAGRASTTDLEERTATPRPAAEKTKKEEVSATGPAQGSWG